MPTPTDLVTDLPADFEVFGQAVDSSMADLLGGTTGQILAKNSNTNMDFVWIANDQGDITGITASSPLTGGGTSGAVTVGIQDATTAQKGAVQLENSTSSTSTTTAAVPASVKSAYDLANGAIPKSLIDAAGDLIVGTAADTAGRLGIGTAGQVLKVNSGATALEWGTAGGGGSVTKISTVDFSAVSSQNFEGVFTSTYTFYTIMINNIYGSSAVALNFRLLYSTNTEQVGNYYGGFYGANGNGTYASIANNGVNQINMGTMYTSDGNFYTINIGAVGNSSQLATGVVQGYSANDTRSLGGAIRNETGRTYTGFNLFPASGTMTGTVSIYGWSK